MNSGTTFVLAVLAWLILSIAVALWIGRLVREADREDQRVP